MRQAASWGRNSFQNRPVGPTRSSSKSVPAATAWAAVKSSAFGDEARVSVIAEDQLFNRLGGVLGFFTGLENDPMVGGLAAHRIGIAGVTR
ncbi:protein of unknown function [Candidatus Nitrotoga arctica]|uniref:Uncharacterized protein n=1 Tax=Candidatus Nitrotoga arctica TaxID=453162 RepID=A0ABM8Z0A7_9PROT|nr:protein of unknown function [Candidatus Nitrotoga arctica]